MIRLLLCTSLVLLYILCACTTALAAGSGTFSDTVLISLVSRLHWPHIFSACTHTLMLPPTPTPTHFAAVSNNYVTVTSYHSFGFEIPQWDLFRRHSSILLKNASRCWWHCDLHRSVCCKLSSLSAVTKIICLIQKCSQKADKSRMIQFLHKKKVKVTKFTSLLHKAHSLKCTMASTKTPFQCLFIHVSIQQPTDCHCF